MYKSQGSTTKYNGILRKAKMIKTEEILMWYHISPFPGLFPRKHTCPRQTKTCPVQAPSWSSLQYPFVMRILTHPHFGCYCCCFPTPLLSYRVRGNKVFVNALAIIRFQAWNYHASCGQITSLLEISVFLSEKCENKAYPTVFSRMK